ncbi:YrhB family protein [Actinoplanes sp. NPDC051470]
MDVDAARAQATATLRQIEEGGHPLALLDPDSPIEHEWCWLFPFNTARAIETGDFMHSLAVGPLVVPKSGDEPWVAPSSPPVEKWLNAYAERMNLTLVPLP